MIHIQYNIGAYKSVHSRSLRCCFLIMRPVYLQITTIKGIIQLYALVT